VFLGDPLHNEDSRHQRLSNPIALAVFSSDAISSVAYATGEIILVLSLAGAAFLHLAWWISLAIGAPLIIVAISYRQTIRAYPSGGGSYIVAREPLRHGRPDRRSFSRAARAATMLLLSPLVTAANASACSMPALISVSRSKTSPLRRSPLMPSYSS
jgi:amino acid transporter